MLKITKMLAVVMCVVLGLALVQPASAGILVQSADLDPGAGECYAFTSDDGTTVTNANAWTAPAGITSIKLMVVAGGGGGANDRAGGGGAGGLVWIAEHPVTPLATYSITVGAGGLVNVGAWALNGVDSSFGGEVAIGGGAGGGGKQNPSGDGNSGGSGGGASSTDKTGGAGTPGQGNAGGNGVNWEGGGGGGAGGVGVNATIGPGRAGAGGDGKDASVLFGIDLTSIGDPAYPGWFAGGGGGGSFEQNFSSLGGKGGGGYGGFSPTVNSTTGVDNTGGGGGGGRASDAWGSPGGSGIVVISYVPEPATMILLSTGLLGLLARRRRRA